MFILMFQKQLWFTLQLRTINFESWSWASICSECTVESFRYNQTKFNLNSFMSNLSCNSNLRRHFLYWKSDSNWSNREFIYLGRLLIVLDDSKTFDSWFATNRYSHKPTWRKISPRWEYAENWNSGSNRRCWIKFTDRKVKFTMMTSAFISSNMIVAKI